MSYILDALKKAEQERVRGHVPGLDTIHQAVFPTPTARRLWPWIALMAVLIVNAWLLTMYWQGEEEQPVSSERPAPVPAANALPPRAVAATPVPRIATPTPAAESSPPRENATRGGVVTLSTEPLTDLEPEGTDTAAAQPSIPPVAIMEDAEAPLLQDMPMPFRQSVPELNLDVHVYAAAAEQRFVLLNMNKYHEGDALPQGLVLERITAEGIVVSHQGQRFRVLRQ